MTGPGSEGVRDVGAMMRPEESATAPDAPRAKRRRTDTVIGNNDAGAIGTAINQGAAATDTVMGAVASSAGADGSPRAAAQGHLAAPASAMLTNQPTIAPQNRVANRRRTTKIHPVWFPTRLPLTAHGRTPTMV